jgi:lipoate-protein ligase A
MALDQALLDLAQEQAVLRFYGWSPACLSLGYFQKPEQVCNAAFVRAAGLGLARRPTGGGAIFHQHELTLSLVLPQAHPACRLPLEESYRLLTQPVADLLAGLGLKCALRGGPPPHTAHAGQAANCFAGQASTDLLCGPDKVFGSAQRRRPHALLFHGSLLLDIDPALWRGVFGPALGQGFTSLRSLLGRPVAAQELAGPLGQGYARLLGLALQASQPTSAELACAQQLEPRFRIEDQD